MNNCIKPDPRERAGLSCRAGIHCLSARNPYTVLGLIKDIKVQVNKQKPKIDCPAQMKHNSYKMTIAPISSQPCSKPKLAVCALMAFY
jgi:hypothetical protein